MSSRSGESASGNQQQSEEESASDDNRQTSGADGGGSFSSSSVSSVRETKRQRWLAKQEKLRKRQRKEQEQKNWISRNSSFALLVTADNVQRIKSSQEEETTLISKLLRPYFDLQEASSKLGQDDDDDETLFIAEGTETVRLLIQQQQQQSSVENKAWTDDDDDDDAPIIQVKSIFVKPSVLFEPPVSLLTDVERASRKNRDKVPPFHVLVGTEDVQSLVAGFHISRGALACGVVPQRNFSWLTKYYLRQILSTKTNGRLRLLALDGISDTANLGSMIRSASAFGVHAILMSSDCCDCWYRRAVRVSMGHVFRIPCVRMDNDGGGGGIDLAESIRFLSSDPLFQVTSYAAVIDTTADLILERVEKGTIPKSWCAVMGNESHGISNKVRQACTHTIRIDMDEGVDSLSAPIAAGILLHGLKERES